MLREYELLPGNDPGSVRVNTRLRKLRKEISKVENDLNKINSILSTTYPFNFIALENDEKELQRKLGRMKSKKWKIHKAKINKAKSSKFGHPVTTKSLNRNNRLLTFNRQKVRRSSPNRRTTKRRSSPFGGTYNTPIGSMPTAVYHSSNNRYGLPSFYLRRNRNLSNRKLHFLLHHHIFPVIT